MFYDWKAFFLAENTTSFRNLGTKFTSKCFPGCEGTVFRSADYWACYVRHFTFTLGDAVGTASMGFPGSPFGVTDSELRVMGVNNLRVVDASVMPTIVGANAQAATIMIGETWIPLWIKKTLYDDVNDVDILKF
jgi:choline dehydrogenase-like flavoprotein